MIDFFAPLGWSLEWSRPWVLLALVLVPLYAGARHRSRHRTAVPYAPLQYRPKVGRRRRWAAGHLLSVETLVLAAVLVGLAGPYTETPLDLIEDEGVDVALVLDISLSMQADDFPPTRIEAMREMAQDFIARSGSNRTGLVIFAKDTFVQSPLTTDHSVLHQLLDGVRNEAIDHSRSGGTAIGDALLVAADLLLRSRLEGRDQALILITDGQSNEGTDPVLAARYLYEQAIRFYAIGVGGDEPVELDLGNEEPYIAILDDTQLKEMTKNSDGRYYRALDVDALERVFGELSRLESAPLEVRRLDIRRYLSSYLAMAALPFFAISLVLGGLVLRRPLR